MKPGLIWGVIRCCTGCAKEIPTPGLKRFSQVLAGSNLSLPWANPISYDRWRYVEPTDPEPFSDRTARSCARGGRALERSGSPGSLTDRSGTQPAGILDNRHPGGVILLLAVAIYVLPAFGVPGLAVWLERGLRRLGFEPPQRRSTLGGASSANAAVRLKPVPVMIESMLGKIGLRPPRLLRHWLAVLSYRRWLWHIPRSTARFLGWDNQPLLPIPRPSEPIRWGRLYRQPTNLRTGW